jgi:hypothetical protein
MKCSFVCRKALEHMPPLSLGVSSGDRPQFLSRHVLEEMDTFVTDLTTYVMDFFVFVFIFVSCSVMMNAK